MGRAPEQVRLVSSLLLLGVTALPLAAQQRAVGKPAELKVIEVKEKDGQILSFRHLTASTEVRMRGTDLAPEARIQLKVQSRPGFVEIDINRGDIVGLKPAPRLGKDFLTYVMWVVSVDGRASNLGEVTFVGEHPVSINVTTPYQTFWLMVTAEPDYAVVDPSPQVVLYSMNQRSLGGSDEKKALPIKGDLFFYTHYTSYDTAPGALENAPNELLQARKAVELASGSGILAVEPPAGASKGKEEERSREALSQAKAFLTRAEDAYRKAPTGSEVVQFARTAAQIAENARALALGAVGGVFIRQLESDLERLQAELSKVQGELSELRAGSANVAAESPPAPVKTKAEEPTPGVASKPVFWFGLIGWALALLLLLRRQST